MTSIAIAPPIVDHETARALADGPRRVLFLDRDGVINVDRGYVHSKENTEWVSGIFDLVSIAKTEGMSCIVVTNQAGIARGFYGVEQFVSYTEWMHAEFRRRGTPLLATYYCPHHPDFGQDANLCGCRKPAAGMLIGAIKDFEIVPAKSFLVGDKRSDVDAAFAAGLRAAHLVEGHDLGAANAWLRQQLSECEHVEYEKNR